MYVVKLSGIVWPSSELIGKYVGILEHTGTYSGLVDYDLKNVGEFFRKSPANFGMIIRCIYL